MSTEYLYETIFQLLEQDLAGDYLAQSCPSLDELINNKDNYSSLYRETSFNTEQNRGELKALFSSIDAVSPITETMKALNVFIASLSK